jgi:beta-lactamase class D
MAAEQLYQTWQQVFDLIESFEKSVEWVTQEVTTTHQAVFRR